MSTSYANNFLQSVATYNKSTLGWLQNECCMVATANTEFKDFQNISGNLGSSVTFDVPPQFSVTQGLVAAWQSVIQPARTLVCDQAQNVAISITNQQDIFNMDPMDYMRKIAKTAVVTLATQVDSSLSANFDSSVMSQLTGQLNTNSGPFRYFGNGNIGITSYQQLNTAQVLFENFGADSSDLKMYIPDLAVPPVIGDGLNQFAPNRNNDDARNWMIGAFGTPRVEYYKSNIFPLHTSGSAGVNGTPLTLVSTNDPTGQNVTQLTFSGATPSDPNAVFSGDLAEFIDGISGFANVRYLTWIGQKPSANHVQFRVTSNAASDGAGDVTVNIYPALNWAGGPTRNLNVALQPGMEANFTNSHRAGCLMSGKALMLAMPRLPEESPFDSSVETDPDTGVSMRLTYGSVLGQNQRGFIHSVLYGSVLVPEYSMRMLYPLTEA